MSPRELLGFPGSWSQPVSVKETPQYLKPFPSAERARSVRSLPQMEHLGKRRLIPALQWENGVEGAGTAGGNGSKGMRNSHKSSVTIWMLHFMPMPTCSLSGPNITDFVGVSPMRLCWDKMGPFFFNCVSTFSSQNITGTHSFPCCTPSFASTQTFLCE